MIAVLPSRCEFKITPLKSGKFRLVYEEFFNVKALKQSGVDIKSAITDSIAMINRLGFGKAFSMAPIRRGTAIHGVCTGSRQVVASAVIGEFLGWIDDDKVKRSLSEAFGVDIATVVRPEVSEEECYLRSIFEKIREHAAATIADGPVGAVSNAEAIHGIVERELLRIPLPTEELHE